MKLTIDDMMNEVFAASLGGQRAELVRLAKRERINNDIDVVAFYLAKLALDGSQLALATLDQFIALENTAGIYYDD